MRLLDLRQLNVQLFELGFRFHLDLLLFGFLSADFGQVAFDLGAALAVAFLYFGELHHFDLQAMHSLG